VAVAIDEARDDREVDDALAVADAAKRVGEDRDVGHALFEQVADPFWVVFE
jgi:hypothetical protein